MLRPIRRRCPRRGRRARPLATYTEPPAPPPGHPHRTMALGDRTGGGRAGARAPGPVGERGPNPFPAPTPGARKWRSSYSIMT